MQKDFGQQNMCLEKWAIAGTLSITNDLPEFQNINANIEFKGSELNVNILSGSAAGLNFDKSKIILNELSNSYKVALDLNLAGKFNSLKEFKNLKVPIFEDISKDFEKLSFSTTATNKIDLEFDKKGNLLNTSVKGKADISNLELDLVQNAFPNILDEKNRKFKNGKLKAEFDKKSIFIDGIIFNQSLSGTKIWSLASYHSDCGLLLLALC